MQNKIKRIAVLTLLGTAIFTGCQKNTEDISSNVRNHTTKTNTEYQFVQDFSNALLDRNTEEVKQMLGKQLVYDEGIDDRIQELYDYLLKKVESLDYYRLDEPNLNGTVQNWLIINFRTEDGVRYQLQVGYTKVDEEIQVESISKQQSIEDAISS